MIVRCHIPSFRIGTCDLEWGHEGDTHANSGDGFYARDHEKEHKRRQRALKKKKATGD